MRCSLSQRRKTFWKKVSSAEIFAERGCSAVPCSVRWGEAGASPRRDVGAEERAPCCSGRVVVAFDDVEEGRTRGYPPPTKGFGFDDAQDS